MTTDWQDLMASGSTEESRGFVCAESLKVQCVFRWSVMLRKDPTEYRVFSPKAVQYRVANRAKTRFDAIYMEPTPHNYMMAMTKIGYEIGERVRPYCMAAIEQLSEQNNGTASVRILDVGCSYGVGSASVNYNCSFDEVAAFLAAQPAQHCREHTRVWFGTMSARNICYVGLDRSKPAVRFALEVGLLDHGIVHDLEKPGITLGAKQRSWLRGCNLMISVGTIGYITDQTLDIVIQHLGKDHPGAFGPCAVVTILRMFDPAPIKAVFEKYGFRFGGVPGVVLPQRRFTDEDEQRRTLKLLQAKGIDTRGREDQGKQFAVLYVAARPTHFSELCTKMKLLANSP